MRNKLLSATLISSYIATVSMLFMPSCVKAQVAEYFYKSTVVQTPAIVEPQTVIYREHIVEPMAVVEQVVERPAPVVVEKVKVVERPVIVERVVEKPVVVKKEKHRRNLLKLTVFPLVWLKVL